MAAGSVIFYQHAIEDMMKGLLDLASASVWLDLVSHGYTPNAKSHSVWSADVSPNIVVASGYASKLLVSPTIARTSGSYVTWDGTDATLSAAATMKGKYVVMTAHKGKATERLVAYFDTETTQTTGVEVTQLVVQWNALGIAQINNPSA